MKEKRMKRSTEFRVCLSGAFDTAEAHMSAIILGAGHVRSGLKKRGKWENVLEYGPFLGLSSILVYASYLYFRLFIMKLLILFSLYFTKTAFMPTNLL